MPTDPFGFLVSAASGSGSGSVGKSKFRLKPAAKPKSKAKPKSGKASSATTKTVKPKKKTKAPKKTIEVLPYLFTLTGKTAPAESESSTAPVESGSRTAPGSSSGSPPEGTTGSAKRAPAEMLSQGKRMTGKGRPENKKEAKWSPKQTMYPWRRAFEALKTGKTFVGIDMSMGNPGLTVVNSKDRTMKFYFLTPDRKTFLSGGTYRLTAGPMTGWTVTVVCLERPVHVQSDNYKARFDRYNELIILWTQEFIHLDPEDTVVGIEHYAYSASTTAAYTKLMEMGGVLRHKLNQAGFHVYEFSPSYVKRMFTGNGKASKKDMCDVLVDKLGIDLFSWTDINIRANKSLNPIDDMADAMGVAISAMIQ